MGVLGRCCSSQDTTKMRTRTMCRPTPHLYSYQRMLAAQSSSSSSSSAVAESSSSRLARASSVSTGVERTTAGARAATVAPATSAGSLDLQGYSGYYGRQLAQAQASSSTATASAATAAAVSAVSQAKSSAVAAKSTSVSATKTTTVSEKTTETLEKSTLLE